MKRAIVLSGGGAKGAYQIGVWKALRKLKLDYSIVTGTSVGALNGAFFVQKDYLKAVHMWYHMSFSHVFEHMDGDYHTLEGKKNILLTYAKGILNGGMDITRLEETLDKYLSVKRFYHSPIDFGLITVNLSDMKPVPICKKDIKPQELKDYLIASASCFPAFPVKEIHGKKYVDGGYYDNIPIHLALDLGADEIIAVDLKAIGLKKKVKDCSVPITYITPRCDLGSFLVFDKTLARRAMRLGYLDTMKTFHKLEGNYYTFYAGELKKITHKYFEPFYQVLDSKLQEYIKSKSSDLDAFVLEMVEFLGKSFAISEEKIYTARKFHHILKKQFKKTKLLDIRTLKEDFKQNEFNNYMGMVLKHWCQLKDHQEEINKKFHFLPMMKIAAFYLEYIVNNTI